MLVLDFVAHSDLVESESRNHLTALLLYSAHDLYDIACSIAGSPDHRGFETVDVEEH